MKKMLVGLLLLVSTAVLAEPSFNDIQSLIEQHQYSAAESGLVEIIKNHPQSAKAYYTMAQAQAGLGNLEKARYALDKAQGLEPSLSFADSGAVKNLRQAISPQTSKIEAVPESNFWTYFFILIGIGLLYFVYRWYNDNKENDSNSGSEPTNPWPKTPSPSSNTQSTSSTTSTRSSTYRSTPRPSTAANRTSNNYTQQPQVVNHYHNDNSSDLLTGVLLGEALANNHSHDTVVVQQSAPVYVPTVEAPISRNDYFTPSRTPEPTRDTSWDDTPVKSNSWDSSSSSSSSWDDDSSSKSSSSWSSSSSSSSSWDSGSSSSSSSWDSGSSSDSSSSSWD